MNLVHGESTILVDGEIIIIHVKGLFNRQGVQAAFEKLQRAIESNQLSQFKLMFDYLEVEGATPDGYEEINQCNVWLNNQNMLAKAIVIDSITSKQILENRTPAASGQNYQHFLDRKSARTWLETI